MGKDYYDFLNNEDKASLAREFLAGPRTDFDDELPPGVHPGSDIATLMRIEAKRFNDKFLRNDRCTMGHYPDGYVDRPAIAQRLADEGYL